MNKKQLICMWVGIVAIVFFSFLLLERLYSLKWFDVVGFMIIFFLIILVTIGLIITLKDKKQKDD